MKMLYNNPQVKLDNRANPDFYAGKGKQVMIVVELCPGYKFSNIVHNNNHRYDVFVHVQGHEPRNVRDNPSLTVSVF